jgi:ATP-dependent Clp protease ATP-binding subunit ClpA
MNLDSDALTKQMEYFTGREWVFRAINDWLSKPHGPRTFLLVGEPGSGKTTIARRLAQFSSNRLPPPEGLSSP